MCFWKIEVLIGSSSQFSAAESISTAANDHIGPPLQPLYQRMIHLMWMSTVWQVWPLNADWIRTPMRWSCDPQTAQNWMVDLGRSSTNTLTERIAFERDLWLSCVACGSTFFEFRTHNLRFQMIHFRHQNRWFQPRVGSKIARDINLHTSERSAPPNTRRTVQTASDPFRQNGSASSRVTRSVSLRARGI